MTLFGSSAELLIDLNLILQYVNLLLLIIGYIRKKPFRTHGYIMTAVLSITVVTTLLIMAPRLMFTLGTYGPAIFAHAILGIAAMLLGAIFSLRFIRALQTHTPLKCGNRYTMWIALFLWIFPLLGGTMVYIILYL